MSQIKVIIRSAFYCRNTETQREKREKRWVLQYFLFEPLGFWFKKSTQSPYYSVRKQTTLSSSSTRSGTHSSFLFFRTVTRHVPCHSCRSGALVATDISNEAFRNLNPFRTVTRYVTTVSFLRRQES